MNFIESNTSVLVPTQFPAIFQEDGPNFVAFVQSYYEWLEEANNALYYTRNYYNIKDIDTTFDEFIVYFKEKYLKNIQFATETNIRTVIKHALDIYRSKGTERCTRLIFQLAFDQNVDFYYPSTDLFKLSDGIWFRPVYLELIPNWQNNVLLMQQEIVGLQSGASAFVDSVVRRRTNGRYQDIAYISAVTGEFITGEQIKPTSGVLDISQYPVITGSLNSITFETLGSGQNYTVGSIIPVSSPNGNGGIVRISNTTNQEGIVEIDFDNGGYGYIPQSNIYISEAVLTLSNVEFSSSNLEFVNYFGWLETITQPMATINYISANGTLSVGANVFTYYGNGSQMGSGTILSAESAGPNTGTIVVNILSGNVANTLFTSSNVVTANLSSTNGYTNSTALGNFIANNDWLIVNIADSSGYILNEEVFQQNPLTTPGDDEKIEGWGYVNNVVNSTALLVNNVEGFFRQNHPLIGLTSNTTSNIQSVSVTLGITANVGAFFNSPFSYYFSTYTTGLVSGVSYSGTGLTVAIANSVDFSEVASINTDKISSYMNTALNATSWGFPANPTGNLTNGTISSLFTYTNVTIGQLSSVYMTGPGFDFSQAPFVVIDYPLISETEIYDDILEYNGATVAFANGEIITQAATGARGMVKPTSNGEFLYLLRMKYANDFVVTANSSTQITGTTSGAVANVINVDYDYMSQVMGRNAIVLPTFATGNNVVVSAQVVDSGFGFLENEPIDIGSNGAIGFASIENQGIGSGFYSSKGGFLSDQKKLFDGYFYQNFSYQIISPLMVNKYYQMMQDITHVSGTIMFGRYVHNASDDNSLSVKSAIISIT